MIRKEEILDFTEDLLQALLLIHGNGVELTSEAVGGGVQRLIHAHLVVGQSAEQVGLLIATGNFRAGKAVGDRGGDAVLGTHDVRLVKAALHIVGAHHERHEAVASAIAAAEAVAPAEHGEEQEQDEEITIIAKEAIAVVVTGDSGDIRRSHIRSS